jgi:DNA topoisomerase-1
VPPPRYSDATLVKKLEELGIGRPSTYQAIVGTLTTGRGYVVKGDREGVKIPVTDLHLKDGSITRKARVETVGAERGKLLPQEIGIIVSDYLVRNFGTIMDYDFTANVEKDFDEIAEGEKAWNATIADFYGPFHRQVESVLQSREYSRVSRELGTAPDGQKVTAAFGKFGSYVQKGEGPDRQFASLGKGQLIETLTLEEALKLFELPRTVGEYEGIPVIATKGRYGPYLKYGDRNVKLPRNADPLKISLEECVRLIAEEADAPAPNPVIAAWGDIQIVNGRYGPYLKAGENNYRIPKGTDVTRMTEADCQSIIQASEPTSKGRKRFKK